MKRLLAIYLSILFLSSTVYADEIEDKCFKRCEAVNNSFRDCYQPCVEMSRSKQQADDLHDLKEELKTLNKRLDEVLRRMEK